MSKSIIKNMIVGLTGGIGSGKSAAGKYFIELGIDVIDADHVAKDALDKNKEGKEQFLKNFGSEFLDDQNKICLLYTSPSPRDATLSRMPSSA